MSVSPILSFFPDLETACVYILDSGESTLHLQEDVPQKM